MLIWWEKYFGLVGNEEGLLGFAESTTRRSIDAWDLVVKGEIVDRSLHLAHRLATFNQTINFLEYRFINPNLTADSADLGRNVLEEIKPIAEAFLVGDAGQF